jgi:uncharacterized surface protein with fasciclin (FAS1) repeats
MERTAPSDGSSRWDRQRPSGNGTRSSSDGWTESYKPSRAWGDRYPGDGRQAGRAPAQQVRENIVALATADRQLSTLVMALKAADLVDTLEGRGPFTIFAPTNEAFSKLPAGKLQDLLKPENRNELREILTYHVVSGNLKGDQLTRMRSLRSLQGQTLTIAVKNGKVYVDDAEIEGVGLGGTNGVIHIINQVLIPE